MEPTGTKLGYLRKCMDKRFGHKTREAFERVTGLTPTDYWVESYPGGAALPPDKTGVEYANTHGATIFGWQAHGNGCGGQQGVSDEEIQARLDSEIQKLKAAYPGTHYRIFVTESGIDVREV